MAEVLSRTVDQYQIHGKVSSLNWVLIWSEPWLGWLADERWCFC
jgi:hypothetical protein